MDLAHLSEKEEEGRKKKEEKLKLRWRHLGGEGVGEEEIQEKMEDGCDLISSYMYMKF